MMGMEIARFQPPEIAASSSSDSASGDGLGQLVTNWITETSASHETRRAYLADLNRLATYLAARDIHPLNATRGDVALWAETMRNQTDATGRRRISENTIARRLSVVSSFYTYAADIGIIPVNPIAKMKRPKRNVDEDGIAWFNTEEMRTFLRAAAADGPRSHALVATMLTTAARVSEVTGADIEHLGHTGGHRVLRVLRKGGKWQSLPVAPWVGVAIDGYLNGRTAGPLFATKARDGGYGRMTEYAVHRLVRKLARRAGLPQAAALRPHSLRHSALTAALERGKPLREVQALAGHADPRTTERYDRMRGRLDKSPAYDLAEMLAD